MSKTLTNTRFFFESVVQTWLLSKYNEDDLKVIYNTDFSFDIVDQPFHCMVNSDDDCVEIKLFIRSELGIFEESPDLGARFYPKKDEAELIANTKRIGGDPAGTLMAIYNTACELSKYVVEKELAEDYSDIDLEDEGIILTVNNDELSFKKVAGKNRPLMACTTLFGGVQMMRPYQNEIMDSWMDEMLPLEEKIELAEEGDEDLMEQLALAYLNGDDEVDVDPEQSFYWFNKLAQYDHSDAQFNLGLFYAKGFGVERNFEKAVYWLERAAENGDTDGDAFCEKIRKAVEAEKIISTNDAQAQADLAGVYMFLGNSLDQAGPAKDYELALEYATKSAEQNNGDGIWALALCYEHGRGVEKDIAKTVELYKRGAELGHAPSQHSLACYYFRGDFLEKDYEKAFDLCLKSANQGYGLAMADVGRCYQFGNGVMGNMKKAVEWYEKSLEVIYDPELARKTEMFKAMGEVDPHWGEDYEGIPEDDEITDENDADLPEGYMEALEVFEEVEAYEMELAFEDFLPDAPLPCEGPMTLSPETFPRVSKKAEEGDERALDLIAKILIANESGKNE